MKTIEELKEDAKKMYPPGTKFIPVNASDSDSIVIVRKTWNIQSHNDSALWFNTRNDDYAHTGYIYNKGRWAKIIHDGQPLLEMAKKLYPIGTQYKCAAGGTTIYTVREQSFQYIDDKDQVYGEEHKGCLYHKGNWAKIINVVTEADDKLLELGEEVLFPLVDGTFVKYRVRSTHLGNTDTGDNKFILDYLGIKNRYEFCESIYGYKPSPGGFPEYHSCDREAVTRIVKEIMKLCYQKITASKDKPTELPNTGFISMRHGQHYDVLSILKITRKRVGEAHFDDNYLVWNTDEYWFVTEKPNRYYKEVNQLINPINNSENEKHTSTESRAAILQSSNLKIGQGSISRGIGLKGSISKVRLGNHGSNYQERLSYS